MQEFHTTEEKIKLSHSGFYIGEEFIKPGENKTIKLNAGKLPSDNSMHVVAHVFNSGKEGDILLIIGGLHGDEINSIEIVRRSLERKFYTNLKQGAVIVIPLVNVYGFLEFSRDISDGKDINRSFPGLKNGSLASRVARLISEHFLSKATCILDFHTGGGTRYNFPHTRFFPGDLKATEMARIFGASVMLESKLIGKSLRKSAFDKFIPTVVFEGAESGRYCQNSIDVGLAGIQNILSFLNMTETPVTKPENIVIIRKNSWIRAPKAGMFVWTEAAGSFIRKGQKIGVISDPYGIKTYTILSKKEGFILGHNNASVVSLGDPLFHVGTEYSTET